MKLDSCELHWGAFLNLRPDCAVCQQPVARMTAVRDIMSCQLEITLECHGARETIYIEEDLVVRSDGKLLLGKPAFVPRAPKQLR